MASQPRMKGLHRHGKLFGNNRKITAVTKVIRMKIWQRTSVRKYLVCYESPEITRGKNPPHTVGLVEQKSIPAAICRSASAYDIYAGAGISTVNRWIDLCSMTTDSKFA